MKRRLKIFYQLLPLVIAAIPCLAQITEPTKSLVHGDTMYTVLTSDDIQTISKPEFIPASEADELYYDDERVIAVLDGDSAKAFSTVLLDYHEIVNTSINGAPIIVTWSPLSFTGIVYRSDVDSKQLTFRSSGSFWRDAVVMQDQETKSLWSQVSGECIQGKLVGKMLTVLPAIHTTYGKFAEWYPDGVVLKKPVAKMAISRYTEYFLDKSRLGIFGRIDIFDKLEGKNKVFGIRLENKLAAVSEIYLSKHHFALFSSFAPPIVVTYDKLSRSVAAFVLPVDSAHDFQKFSFRRHEIVSGDSVVVWNSHTGKVMSGEGAPLNNFPVISAFWFVWATFYPETELIY